MDPRDIADTTVKVIIAILCTCGNCLIMLSLKKFEWLRVATNYFVALLAFYDFCNGLSTSSLMVARLLISQPGDNITVEYNVICKMNVYIAAFAGYGNLLCLIIITMDRYIYINWPLRYYELVTNRKALVVSINCLLLTSVVSAIVSYGQDVVKPCLAIKMFRFDVIVSVGIPTFLLAFVLVILLYGKIAWLAYKAKKSIANQMTASDQSGSQKRTTKVISLVVGVFMATYLMAFVGFFINLRVNNVWLQTIVVWLWTVSHFILKCTFVFHK